MYMDFSRKRRMITGGTGGSSALPLYVIVGLGGCRLGHADRIRAWKRLFEPFFESRFKPPLFVGLRRLAVGLVSVMILAARHRCSPSRFDDILMTRMMWRNAQHGR
jgi:hypothetical protein